MQQKSNESQGFTRYDNRKRRKRRKQTSATFLYLEAQFSKLSGILSGALVVGQNGNATGLEDSSDVMQCGDPHAFFIEIMQAEIRDDNVKGCIRKRHFGGGFAYESAAIGDALEFQVMPGCLLCVSCEVFGGPDVDSGRVTACIQMLGGSRKEQTATAAYIEDLFVAGPCVKREHEVAMEEFADLHVEEVETGFSEQEKGRPEKRWTCSDGNRSKAYAAGKKKAEDETKETKEKQIPEDGWSVDPVVRLCRSQFCRGAHR